ncbi:chemotaxis protein CheW [Sphingomonas koreensis]|uniref:chemotaxis protein CheW n=1 Tax=Sphingomonas koreensis TaxID=93064 RepID=UPI000831EA9B|nr:chemotaxis protein CheW [Sphingomonas koreensis]PJI87835.1 purine-binding chemotaxis protein CheW [Sphingomonas koreensis]RSU58403.1 chemotaxis protein CheW [Sphingomonas koreensis]RSU71884.1 chemotaxis protein CheW [Sphingomonas koreensis]
MTDHITTSTPWDDQGQLEVLTFDLQGETLALEAFLVREIIDLLPETPVPGALPLVGSVVNFRGRIIPVADLRLAFGMATAEATVDSRIVVIETDLNGESIQLGVRTDRVHEVTTLHRSASEQPPLVGMRWRRDYLRELVRRDEGVVLIPDLPAIFRSLDAPARPAEPHLTLVH